MNEYRLEIYVRNERHLVSLIENCAKMIAKKIKKGIEIDLNKLAMCPTVAKIVSDGAKVVQKYDDITLTREERKEGKFFTAREIINRANEMIDLKEI